MGRIMHPKMKPLEYEGLQKSMNVRPKASYCSADGKAELFWSGEVKVSQGKPTTSDYLISLFGCIPLQLILAATVSWLGL